MIKSIKADDVDLAGKLRHLTACGNKAIIPTLVLLSLIISLLLFCLISFPIFALDVPEDIVLLFSLDCLDPTLATTPPPKRLPSFDHSKIL